MFVIFNISTCFVTWNFTTLGGNIVSGTSLLTRCKNLFVLIEIYEKIKIEVTFS